MEQTMTDRPNQTVGGENPQMEQHQNSFEHKHSWGRWVLDADSRHLCWVQNGSGHLEYTVYDIGLDGIHSATRIVRTVANVAARSWATPADVGNLTEALIDIFGISSDLHADAEILRPARIQ